MQQRLSQYIVRVLDYRRNNEGLMLIYNLAVIKNFKIKVYTEDESREKQRNHAKITLIAPELAQKKSLNKHQNLNEIFMKFQ